MQTWLMNKAVCPPVVRQEPDNMLNLLDVDFWLWYQKVTPKGMAHAFRIRFWETFNAPGTYDILTDNQYKLPNSNDGCMRLRAPTACPEWNEGTEEDEKVLHWLSRNAHLWVWHRGNRTVHQKAIGKCHFRQNVEWSCKAYSYQAGHMTSSMPRQGSRVDYCPIVWYLQAVYTAWSTVWCSKSADKTKWWCHDCWWASETCSWFKQTPWWHGCHRRWTNILVHLPIVKHDGGVLLLVGEGVRYHISYF